MTDLGNHNLDHPFQEAPAGMTLDLSDAVLSGGLIVQAAAVPVPEAGVKPAIVFRFVRYDGQPVQPVVLIEDDDQMAKLRPLINEAVAAARRAAQS